MNKHIEAAAAEDEELALKIRIESAAETGFAPAVPFLLKLMAIIRKADAERLAAEGDEGVVEAMIDAGESAACEFSEYISAGDRPLKAMMRAALAVARLSMEDVERKLKEGLRAVDDLMNESEGVAGLHLNGEVAPWGSLRTGGRFEPWLIEFDEALALCGEDAARAKEAGHE